MLYIAANLSAPLARIWSTGEIDDELEKKFEEAGELISKGKPTKGAATTEEKLVLYGHFKQAKIGDNTTGKPRALQWETKA